MHAAVLDFGCEAVAQLLVSEGGRQLGEPLVAGRGALDEAEVGGDGVEAVGGWRGLDGAGAGLLGDQDQLVHRDGGASLTWARMTYGSASSAGGRSPHSLQR